ncbi:MAG: protein kinase [Bacteroidales bacterium]|jgi:serine/threonine protein kinase|nr:protein kinase [Bacteroidales bacterium]
MPLEQNTLFHSHYLLKKLLGRGGFSEVWLVENTLAGNIKMALKIYAPGAGLDDDGVTLFSKEFELVFNINHTNLLRTAHFDVYDRSPYLVMPFCERGSAGKLVGSITEEQAWHFLHDVAAGLAHLHKQEPPIIHQDIKPDNVLIDNSGQYLITDFGISTKARSTLRRSVGDAKSPMTVAYTPPERFDIKNSPIKASDIWSLGATLFELLEGDVPFLDMLGGQAQRNGAEIPEMDEKWSPELRKIVTLCLQKEPWDRPTAEQLLEWAEKYFRGEKIFGDEGKLPSKKPKPQKPKKPIKNPNKSKKISWFVLGGIVLAAAIAIFFWLRDPEPEPVPIEDEIEEVVEEPVPEPAPELTPIQQPSSTENLSQTTPKTTPTPPSQPSSKPQPTQPSIEEPNTENNDNTKKRAFLDLAQSISNIKIYFEPDKDIPTLDDTKREHIKNAADLLKANSDLNVTIAAVIGPEGTIAHNKDLGNRRAMAVRKLFLDQGVPADQIATQTITAFTANPDITETDYKEQNAVIFKIEKK